MPTKHVVKAYDAPAFYHVYNRASGERQLFRDDEDRLAFLTLLQKHLEENYDPDDPVLVHPVQIAAYCLMGSHFHLLIFQKEEPLALTGYMRSVATAYSMHYNRKYKSKGHVFQSSFRASHIDDEAYLAHITRYIHLNPHNYRSYEWSSYVDYLGEGENPWVHPELVIEGSMIGHTYECFVADYAAVDRRKIKTQLSDYLAL